MKNSKLTDHAVVRDMLAKGACTLVFVFSQLSSSAVPVCVGDSFSVSAYMDRVVVPCSMNGCASICELGAQLIVQEAVDDEAFTVPNA